MFDHLIRLNEPRTRLTEILQSKTELVKYHRKKYILKAVKKTGKHVFIFDELLNLEVTNLLCIEM